MYNFSKNKLSWFLLFISSLFFLGSGLYFQYNMGLEPCHLCIVQRISFIIILFAGFITFFSPSNKNLRYFGIGIWGIGSSLGLYSAIKLVLLQMFPVEKDLFSSCTMSATEMMNAYPFLDWFPMLFEAKSSCEESSYSFFGLITMEQLTLIILFSYFITFLWASFSNFKNREK